MRAITGYVIGAVAMAIIGGVCLVMSFIDRDVAHAQEHTISAEYDEPQQILQGVERYYDFASRLPWIGNGPANDIRAREAALQYWQKRYVAIVPEVADPIANLPADNVDLQFVVANAMYREGLTQAKDKATTLGALDAAANAYTTVLRNTGRHDDAAYNYEYIVKLRADVDKGRKKPPMPEADEAGRRGHPPTDADAAKYKVYIPQENSEIDKDILSKAGKQKPLQKKG